MQLSHWFPVAAVVLVLTAAPPVQAQDIPDEATRERVADWIERCDGDWSGACGRVDDYIVERTLGRWCRRLEVQWDTPRLVRSADVDHPAADVAARHRHRAEEFLEKCVPIYAAALARAGTAASDRADAGDTVPGATAGQREVEAPGRTMQVRTRSNVRSGPGMAHDRVEVLDAGTEVRVIGTSGEWMEIAMPGAGHGFIYGPLLMDPASPPTTEPPAPSGDGERGAEAGSPAAPSAARARVADWIERCDGDWSGICGVVGDNIAAQISGSWCRRLEAHWDAPRLVRSGDITDPAADVANSDRHRAEKFLEECVPIYAAALDRANGGDTDSGTTGEQGEVATPGHAMEVVKRADVRIGPGVTYNRVEVLDAGEEVRVIDTSDDWVKVQTPRGRNGFIRGRLLANIETGGPEEPAAPQGARLPASPDTGPSQTGPLHGSIAFSQDDDGAYAWGIAWSFETSVGANAEALAQCRAHDGTECEEVGWFQEACGALAIGGENGYGAGWGSTEIPAQADALENCLRFNDDCRIVASQCAVSNDTGGSGQIGTETAAASPAAAPASGPAAEDGCAQWVISFWMDVHEDMLVSGHDDLSEVAGLTMADAEASIERLCSRSFVASCEIRERTCLRAEVPDGVCRITMKGDYFDVDAEWSGPCEAGRATGAGEARFEYALHYPMLRYIEIYRGSARNGLFEGTGELETWEYGERTFIQKGEYRDGVFQQGSLIDLLNCETLSYRRGEASNWEHGRC